MLHTFRFLIILNSLCQVLKLSKILVDNYIKNLIYVLKSLLTYLFLTLYVSISLRTDILINLNLMHFSTNKPYVFS